MPGESAPTLLKCPKCGGLATAYCTLNDRLAVCPPCAELVRAELTTLTPEKLFKGAAAAAGIVLGVFAFSGVLTVALGPKSDALGWVLALAAVFTGMVAGRSARRAAKVGGLPLQLATIAIALLGVMEIYLAPLMVGDPLSPAAWALAIVAAPPAFLWLLVAKQQLTLLFFVFWAVYDPWRTTAPLAITVRGPFPVQGAQAPAPAAPPPPPPDAAPPPADEAKAAGMDFERPA